MRQNADSRSISVNNAPLARQLSEHALTDEMQNVVSEIDQIFGDVQSASLTAFWRVGKLITEVKNEPDKYLTPEQRL